MRLPEFDHKTCQWDQWRAPHHVYAHNFSQFDTGELIATKWYERDRYGSTFHSVKDTLGLQVLASTSLIYSIMKFKTPDGDDVCRSWFPSGKGYIYDEDAHTLIRTGDLGDNLKVPVRFRSRACAYWTGPGQPPIGGELSLYKPRARTPAEKERARDFIALAKAWHRLDDEAKDLPYMRLPCVGLNLDIVMKAGSFEELSLKEKMWIAWCGISSAIEEVKFTHLMVEK